MQIRVTGRHIDITPAIHQHVEKRLTKLEHIFHNLLDAHAILFPEKDDFVADITVTGSHLTLHVRDRDADMYAAVDRAVHRLERQVRRHKDRVNRKKKQSLSHAERNLQAAEVAEQEREAAEPEEPVLEEVAAGAEAAVRRLEATPPAGPMSLDEALRTFEANGAQFLAFINYESDDVDVLYRRGDGQLGLITRS